MIRFVQIASGSTVSYEDGKAYSELYGLDESGQVWRRLGARWEQIPGPTGISIAQRERLMASVRALNLGGGNEEERRKIRLGWVSGIVGRNIESTKDLTRDEAKLVIESAENATP